MFTSSRKFDAAVKPSVIQRFGYVCNELSRLLLSFRIDFGFYSQYETAKYTHSTNRTYSKSTRREGCFYVSIIIT